MKSLAILFAPLLLFCPINGQSKPQNGDFRTMESFEKYISKFPKECNPAYTNAYKNEYKHFIFRSSLAFDLKANSVFSCLIFQESQFDNNPINSLSSAKGISQMLPGTVKDLYRRYLDPNNAKRNIKFDVMWKSYCRSCKNGNCSPCPPPLVNLNLPREKIAADFQKQLLTPHLALGYAAMNMIDSLDLLKLTFCGSKFKRSKNDSDCVLDLKDKNNLLQFYSAVVVAYNRGIGTVLDALRDKNTGEKIPIEDWTKALMNIKINYVFKKNKNGRTERHYLEKPILDSEARRHTISLQRCLLSDEARIKSDIHEVQQAEGPYRLNSKKQFCNQNECGSSDKIPDSCIEKFDTDNDFVPRTKK